ncbi:MFS transporter [Kibdelosporangium lantanae]
MMATGLLRAPVLTGYGRIVAASGLANLGDGIRQVALPLLVAGTTQNAVLVGGLTACAYVPWMLFGLPIGALVDRGRPELYLFGAAITRTVLFAVLTVSLLADVHSLVLLYVVAFLLGIGEAAYDNASQSMVPRVVADDALEKANGALVSVERLGQDLIGPAVGGVIFAVAAPLPFALTAVAMLVGFVLVMRLRTVPQPVSAPTTPRVVLKEAAAGMRWLWRSRPVRTVIVTGAGLTFFTQTWEPLLVLISAGPNGASPAGFGVILAVGSVGGIVGALGTPALTRRWDTRTSQIGALALVAASNLTLAAWPTPAVAALTLSTTSLAFAVWNVLSTTMRQRLVPAAVLGRVNAASRTLSMTAGPCGAVIGGLVAAVLGLSAPLWLSGAALAGITLVFAVATGDRRRSCESGRMSTGP